MKRALAAIALVVVFVVVGPSSAQAHPLGNFTVNRLAEIVVAPGRVTVAYALDLAEVPAYQTLRELASDGSPTAATLQGWSDRTAEAIARGLVLRLDHRRVRLEVDHAVATVAPGQGGLQTLRLDVRLRAALASPSGRLSFVDRNDPGRLGWREVVARGAGGIALAGSDVPTASLTDGLRIYPEDLLSAPLDVSSMRARFGPGPATSDSTSTGSPGAAAGPGVLDRLLGRSGASVLVLGVLVALALGAWHALLPGHGKTLMAAAAVGAEPRPWDAVVAGLAVAGMHTFSVIGLALVVVVLEQTFRPEAVYPWLRAASGAAAVGVGVHLVRRRWPSDVNDAMHQDRRHHHPDGHEHGHLHRVPAGSLSRPGLAALALAGGILPSPSALLVLLASVQRGRAVYGLVLVLAFSAGLAASLILVGLAATRARRFVTRRSTSVLARSLPVASAFAIVAIGLVVAGGAVASL